MIQEVLEYLGEHPEITAVLIASVIVPTVLIFLKNVKKTLMLEFQVALNESMDRYRSNFNGVLDQYDDTLNDLKVRTHTLEAGQEAFKKQIKLSVDSIESSQKETLLIVKNVEELERQSFERINVAHLQYTDIRERLKFIENKSLRGKLGKDTEGDGI